MDAYRRIPGPELGYDAAESVEKTCAIRHAVHHELCEGRFRVQEYELSRPFGRFQIKPLRCHLLSARLPVRRAGCHEDAFILLQAAANEMTGGFPQEIFIPVHLCHMVGVA